MSEMHEIMIAKLTLDTYRKNYIQPLVVPRGDYGARVIRVNITAQGRPVDVKPSEAVSIVATRRADGESKAFAGRVNDDGTADLPVTQWMLDIPGNDVICHVVVTGNDYQYSTTEFLIEPQDKNNPAELSVDDPRQDIVTEILANESARQSAEEERVKAEKKREEYNKDLQIAVEDLEERVTALEANICFKKGTKILMADGTHKNIEDVEYGEMIMSWDIENNRTIPCKSFGKVFTGWGIVWDHLCFDNGSVLKIFLNHRIFNADKGYLTDSKNWEIGQRGIASNGDFATYCYKPKKARSGLSEKKYTIFCETGMFFANDILCGHPLGQPLDVYNRTHNCIPLTKEEVADLEAYANARDYYYFEELQNAEYLMETLPYRKACDVAERMIAKYKKDLSGRDYKTIKAMQGKLSDADFAENVEVCESLRAKVNEQEEIVKENNLTIASIQEKYNIHPKNPIDIEMINVNKAVAKARQKYADYAPKTK